VRKHLLDDLDNDLRQWRGPDGPGGLTDSMSPYLDRMDSTLMPGEVPPYDADAT
jgi:hypothetical protein